MTAPVSPLVVRRIEPGDVDEVMAIQEACVESAANWPRQAYMGEGGYESLVAVREDGISGFLLFRAAADEMEILNLAVGIRHRREGTGTGLVQAALAAGVARGAKRVFLEMRESNVAAAAFYRRQGFVASGRRSGYYSSPVEDALLLGRAVSASEGAGG